MLAYPLKEPLADKIQDGGKWHKAGRTTVITATMVNGDTQIRRIGCEMPPLSRVLRI